MGGPDGLGGREEAEDAGIEIIMLSNVGY